MELQNFSASLSSTSLIAASRGAETRADKHAEHSEKIENSNELMKKQSKARRGNENVTWRGLARRRGDEEAMSIIDHAAPSFGAAFA